MKNEMVARRRKALVLYGSETGNAQDIADEMGRMIERLHFSTNVVHLNAAEPVCNYLLRFEDNHVDQNQSILSAYTVILISISTTGQGDLPNNARLFWSILLRKRLSPTYLQNAHFTIFGLGNSSYPK